MVEGVGPIAVDEDIRSGQQSFKRSPVTRILEIQPGAPFPGRDIRRHDGFLPSGRIDAENLGSPSRKKARCDGAGQNPRQVQNAQASQGPVAIGTPSTMVARARSGRYQHSLAVAI